MFLIISCKTIRVQPNNVDFENLEPTDLGATRLRFCLDYPGYDKVPVVKINFSDLDFYFVVDTGSTVNTFNRNGINKIMSYEEYKEIVEALLNKEVNDEFLKEFQLGGMNVTWHNEQTGELIEVAFTGEYGDENAYDGILGLPFLRMHKNVCFDYVKKEISFDTGKICDNEIPMIPFIQNSLYYINFKVDEKYERGLIDTGNSVLVTRKNFLKDDEYLTDDDLIKYIIYGENINIGSKGKKNIRNLNIGYVNYPKLQSVQYNNVRSKASQTTRRFASIYSSLGYSCFANHIIQLDFENSLFRIK